MTVVEPGAASSGLVARVKAILLTPKAEWDRIDLEPATVRGLYLGYICILAAIPVVAALIGGQIFGYGAFGVSFKPGLASAVSTAVVSYVLSLVSVFVLALIIDGLAPTFGGQKSQIQAFKVAAYANTAGWVAGIFAILPAIGVLALLGGLYSLYLLYLGLPKLMKAPEEKALPYTAVTVLCAIVLSLVVGAVTAAIGGAMGGLAGASAIRVAETQDSGTVTVGGTTVDLDKLQAQSKQLEAAANAAAAGSASGEMKPVALDSLKGMLPEAVAGYRRTSLESHSAGDAGMGVVSAQGEYGEADKTFRLSVTDMGAAGALAGMAGAFGVQSDKQTADGYEKMGKVDGRLTVEEWDNQSRTGKYSVMVADRFMVEAEGTGPEMADLKRAVAAVDVGRLQALAK